MGFIAFMITLASGADFTMLTALFVMVTRLQFVTLIKFQTTGNENYLSSLFLH